MQVHLRPCDYTFTANCWVFHPWRYTCVPVITPSLQTAGYSIHAGTPASLRLHLHCTLLGIPAMEVHLRPCDYTYTVHCWAFQPCRYTCVPAITPTLQTAGHSSHGGTPASLRLHLHCKLLGILAMQVHLRPCDYTYTANCWAFQPWRYTCVPVITPTLHTAGHSSHAGTPASL